MTANTPSLFGLRPRTLVGTFWIDESGSVSTAGKCMVVGGIKTRKPDDLQRAIHAVREKHGYWSELKFGRMSAGKYRVFTDVVDALEESDAHLVATVIDDTCNPFKGKDPWEAQAEVVAQLVVGSIRRNEVGAIFMDGLSTPAGRSMGNRVKRIVNTRLQGSPILLGISLDSTANDLLQAADLVVGAIRYARTVRGEDTEKAQVARRVSAAFGLDGLKDQRTARANIATLRTARAPRAQKRQTVVRGSRPRAVESDTPA
jgi:hypothetical protein